MNSSLIRNFPIPIGLMSRLCLRRVSFQSPKQGISFDCYFSDILSSNRFTTRQRSLVSSSTFHPYSSTTAAVTMEDKFSLSSFRNNNNNNNNQPFSSWTFDTTCQHMEWTKMNNIPINVQTTTIKNISKDIDDVDILFIGVVGMSDRPKEVDDDELLSGSAHVVDKSLIHGALSNIMVEEEKSFKNGTKLGIMTPTLRSLPIIQRTDLSTNGSRTQRIVAIGLGEREGTAMGGADCAYKSSSCGYTIGKSIATRLKDEKKIKVASILLPENFVSENNNDIIKGIAIGFYDTLYSDNRYRTGDRIKITNEDLTELRVLIECSDDEKSVTKLDTITGSTFNSTIDDGRKVASGLYLAKDIVNAPHNVLNSECLADTAMLLAEESNGMLRCNILDTNDCEQRGMGAYLGVARGSETQPKFIHLIYTSPGVVETKLAIIGKGVVFDTGGYNIKLQNMEFMKKDCAGGAAVIGAARAISQITPSNIEVHFIIPACENMINARSMVPSDILTASNGKTIEVMNTDGEGRLTLADALVYADKELGCDKIIELSTLTGACAVALGRKVGGLFTNDTILANELLEISMQTGDKIWRLPIAMEYKDELDSQAADIKNIGSPYGGAITAAIFLQEFVSGKKPFAHIDMSGPSWNDKTGATGYGVQLITEWILKSASRSARSK